jgi:hypothetical protein
MEPAAGPNRAKVTTMTARSYPPEVPCSRRMEEGQKFEQAKGHKIGIWGQAPSDYSEFAPFHVEQGIDSISLHPDTVLKTRMAILERERKADRAP